MELDLSVFEATDWSKLEFESLVKQHAQFAEYIDDPDSSHCFYNGDKGHPSYLPLKGSKAFGYADGPDKNKLFMVGETVLAEINQRIASSNSDLTLITDVHLTSPFKSWEDFKAAIIRAYEHQSISH